MAVEQRWSVRELRVQIDRKRYERGALTELQAHGTLSPALMFHHTYLPDFLGLQPGYLEADLEQAILRELEQFILTLGRGFAFVERQKRMVIDGEDFYLDLLFYHRKLKRGRN
jgi:predicted nuclease of restriction endonuclease-like (RecB) superfamily